MSSSTICCCGLNNFSSILLNFFDFTPKLSKSPE
nr:MAG TPA: hypothetical protein [Caudoviricetes sp.]